MWVQSRHVDFCTPLSGTPPSVSHDYNMRVSFHFFDPFVCFAPSRPLRRGIQLFGSLELLLMCECT